MSYTAPQDGTSYNVGTQLNAFVYGTLASWYNEDVQAAGQPQRQMALLPGPPPGEPGSVYGGEGALRSVWDGCGVWLHRPWSCALMRVCQACQCFMDGSCKQPGAALEPCTDRVSLA